MIVLRGVSHKTCPVELRERLAARPAAEALSALEEQGVAEAVVLSTCNRFEVYAAVDGDDPGEAVGRALEAWAGRPMGDAAYAKSGAAAVEHLFRVAGGLESLVVGEGEILGQVKAAYEAARQAQMTGKLTNVLFQRAAHVGKLVRSETAVAVGHTSVASVAVDLADRIFGSLQEKEVLILGAGEMAELTSRHLSSCKIGRLVVANRTYERGVELAARFHGEAVRWEEFPARLRTADIVIGATGSDRPVVTRRTVEEALPSRMGRSLFFIDIAMPRDIEEAVNDLDHVYLYSLADLEGVVKSNVARRHGELEKAARLVETKAAEFAAWERTVGTGAEASLGHVRRTPRVAQGEKA